MAETKRLAVLITGIDNVLTVLEPVAAGELVSDGTDLVPALEDIPVYHKIARSDVACGEVLYKYGQPMGYATEDIKRGQWVHTHNADSEKPQGGA